MHTYMYNSILKALNKKQIGAEKQVLQQLEIYSVISVKSSLSEYKAAIKSINLFNLKLCSFWFWCSFTLNKTSSNKCLEYISSVIVHVQYNENLRNVPNHSVSLISNLKKKLQGPLKPSPLSLEFLQNIWFQNVQKHFACLSSMLLGRWQNSSHAS